MELKKWKDNGAVILGTAVMAVGIKVFFEPNDLVAGGVTGLGIVINYFTTRYYAISTPLWLVNLFVDIPLLWLGWRVLGKRFVKRSIVSALLFSFALFYTELIPVYQGNMILVCIFGGLLVGIGAGLVLSAMAATGGTDLAAAVIHQKYTRISVSQCLFLLDAFVIGLGMFVFGIEQAMFAVLSIYISSRCAGNILEGLHFAKAAFIISDKSELIASELLQQAERGVTAFKGRGMFTKKDKEILLCVFSQKEITKVKNIVRNLDSDAFLLLTDMKEVLGEGFEKM